MNWQLVTQAIANVLAGVNYKRQYPAAKWQIKELEELGILEYMPEGFEHSDANAVIESATPKTTPDGETFYSKLYKAMTEVEETTEDFDQEADDELSQLEDQAAQEAFEAQGNPMNTWAEADKRVQEILAGYVHLLGTPMEREYFELEAQLNIEYNVQKLWKEKLHGN